MAEKKIDDGGPAFPGTEPSRLHDSLGGQRSREWPINLGMSLRDYFAANAPPVPVWFEFQYGPQPDRPAILDGDHMKKPRLREACYRWRADYNKTDCRAFDLASVAEGSDEERFLKEYEEKWTAYWEACEDRRTKHDRERFFAWRWCYADAMLAARKVTP